MVERSVLVMFKQDFLKWCKMTKFQMENEKRQPGQQVLGVRCKQRAANMCLISAQSERRPLGHTRSPSEHWVEKI